METTILDIQDVSIYIKNNLILSNLNLSIKQGDFIFLKGGNGSGKSTFFNILAHYNPDGIYKTSGKLIFQNDKDILFLSDTQWYKRQIYYITQTQLELDNTIFEKFFGVMAGIKSISKLDLVKFIDAHDISFFFKDIIPEKLINKKISSLSEGQKKIIEILAGIMRGAYIKLLLIDEPLNHLDTGNIKRVIDLLSELRNQNTELAIILTTHCQAFPIPTQYLTIQSNTIMPATVEYIHYTCFDETSGVTVSTWRCGKCGNSMATTNRPTDRACTRGGKCSWRKQS